MIIRKRQLLLATLVIALCSAVFVNWYYTKPQVAETGSNITQQGTQASADSANLGDARYVISSDVTTAAQEKTPEDFFADAALRRRAAHDEANEALNDIIKDSASPSASVSKATEMLNEIAKSITLESDIESLITAKTGSKCLVILSGGSAEIIVESGVLNDVTIVQIKDIAVNQTGYPAEKITIVELNS